MLARAGILGRPLTESVYHSRFADRKTRNQRLLDTTLIILLLGFPLPGDPHVGERYDTCVQDFSPGGRLCLHMSGSGSPNQHYAESGASADLLDLSRKVRQAESCSTSFNLDEYVGA